MGSDEAPPRRRRLRPRSEEDRRGFTEVWSAVRDHFEEDPGVAVVYADVLVSALLEQKGVADGVAEARLRDQYRLAHEIATHQGQRPVVREDLGRALRIYAVLFHELLPAASPTAGEGGRPKRRSGGAERRADPAGGQSQRRPEEHPFHSQN